MCTGKDTEYGQGLDFPVNYYWYITDGNSQTMPKLLFQFCNRELFDEQPDEPGQGLFIKMFIYFLVFIPVENQTSLCW